MNRILIATTLALATSCVAYAQDPAPKPDANAEYPPTNRMDSATPTMKAPAGAEHAPTNRVDQAVPPMKPGNYETTDTGTEAGTTAFVADEKWIGRSVYSSDDRNLGEVASLSGSNLLVDIGGVLGIGETRTLVKSDQIQDVPRRPDRAQAD